MGTKDNTVRNERKKKKRKKEERNKEGRKHGKNEDNPGKIGRTKEFYWVDRILPQICTASA